MRVPPRVFTRLEAAPKNRMNANSIKIVRRYDASGSALGAVADTEGSPRNLAHKKSVKKRGTPLQIGEVWPGKRCAASFAALRSTESEQSLLMTYRRVRTKQNPFHPTEHRRIRPNPQSQAQNRQNGKTRAPPQHPQTKPQVLKCGFNHGHSSLLAIKLLGLLYAPKISQCLAPRLFLAHTRMSVYLRCHFQMRTHLRV